MSATDDVRDDTSPTTSSAPISEPASAADTIRGAFLKHAIDAERQASGGGLGDGDAAAGTITLRGAFVSRMTTTGPGALRGGGTGEGETLRSVYAARFAALVEPPSGPAPRRRAAKPARRAAAKKAKAAKPKQAKRAKPKKAKAAKPAKAKTAKKVAKAKAAKPTKKVAARAKTKPKAAKRAKAAAATKARRTAKPAKTAKKTKKGKRR